MSKGVKLIAAERKRQVAAEGYDAAHDDAHTDGSLAMAAACYAASETIYVRRDRTIDGYPEHPVITFADAWPWRTGDYRGKRYDEIKALVVAGALIAAEIDRLLRIEEQTQ